jgi:Amt family ammonium transporter
MAERTRFMGYLVYTAIFAGLIYPIFGHWAWGSLAGSVGFGGGLGWLEMA